MSEKIKDSQAILSVSALNSLARSSIERALPLVWVGGEISNLVRAASGHWYFSLKDEQAQVRCAMFRGRNQFAEFVPANGDRVEVRASPTLYEARGDFQLQVELMRRAGLGALFEAFEKLKTKLAAEGLFDPVRKRALPEFPRRVGLVTSADAAALRDVLTTLKRRAPWLSMVLYPTPVQGTGAGAKIAEALRTASLRRECDVLIVCRGGGSIEDLWAFNEEVVARAIAACSIPVVSGVGHETDFTMADFVADLRAPTPTAAAEHISRSGEEWQQHLSNLLHRVSRPLHRQLHNCSQQSDQLAKRLIHPAQRLRTQSERLALLAKAMQTQIVQLHERQRWRLIAASKSLLTACPEPGRLLDASNQLGARLARAQYSLIAQHRTQLAHMAAQLEHLNPHKVLARGYSIVRKADGQVIRNSAQVSIDDPVELRFHVGGADAIITRKETP